MTDVAMDDAEKQFYNDPKFEADLLMMQLQGHLERAKEQLAELKTIADRIKTQAQKIVDGDDA